MAQSSPSSSTSKESRRTDHRSVKKIKSAVQESLKRSHLEKWGGKVQLWCSDEAGFGRISLGAACWAEQGTRPHFASHHIREYNYAYGAVNPISGEHHFMIYPLCNTEIENHFLQSLSERFPNNQHLVIMDNASWHHSQTLLLPKNVIPLYIPPCTPEMNPIEQIWKEIRARGFMNQAFESLDAVTDRLVEVIQGLENSVVRSITGRDWLIDCFR